MSRVDVLTREKTSVPRQRVARANKTIKYDGNTCHGEEIDAPVWLCASIPKETNTKTRYGHKAKCNNGVEVVNFSSTDTEGWTIFIVFRSSQNHHPMFANKTIVALKVENRNQAITMPIPQPKVITVANQANSSVRNDWMGKPNQRTKHHRALRMGVTTHNKKNSRARVFITTIVLLLRPRKQSTILPHILHTPCPQRTLAEGWAAGYDTAVI